MDATTVVGQFEALDGVSERAHYVRFVDFSDVSEATVDFAELHGLAATRKPGLVAQPGLRFVMLAPSEVQFGMARMYSLIMDDTAFEIGVVRTREAAAEFLGVGLDAITL